MKHERVVRNGQVITMSSQIPGEFEDRPIPLGSMALSPDGTTIATGDAGLFMGTEEVSLRDAATGRQRLTFRPGPGDHAGNVQVAALAFSPDGQWLATVVGKAVRISDAAAGRARLTDSRSTGSWPIVDVAFAPDGRSLAACTARTVWIWDLPEP